MTESLGLRATIKIRNDEMISARERLGLNQTELGKLADLHVMDVARFEALRWSDIRGDIRAKASSIAGVLGLMEQDVLPPGMDGVSIQSTRTARAYVPVDSLLSMTKEVRLLASPAADDTAMTEETNRVLREMVSTLPGREAGIIDMRFGLDGQGPRTLEETARAYGVTRERLRQLEIRAIWHLRERKRVKVIEAALTGEREETAL